MNGARHRLRTSAMRESYLPKSLGVLPVKSGVGSSWILQLPRSSRSARKLGLSRCLELEFGPVRFGLSDELVRTKPRKKVAREYILQRDRGISDYHDRSRSRVKEKAHIVSTGFLKNVQLIV